jgi:chlorite dismutase
MTEQGAERAEGGGRSLNHFGVYGLTPEYWRLADAERCALRTEWVQRLSETAQAVHHYQTFPTEVGSDILVWCAVDASDAMAPATFFDAYSRALRPFRRYIDVRHLLWGFTRPSEYSRARSRQEIDPFEARTLPYLVMYPFTKTGDWYLMNRDARQGMMNEHIRIGKQYREIAQLLVYSVGVQDQEFVVVYETAELPMFSRLVSDLRQTEARRFTKSDVPVHTALYRPASDIERLWP